VKLWQRWLIMIPSLAGGWFLAYFMDHAFGPLGLLAGGLFLGAVMKAQKQRREMRSVVERRWRKREQQPTETQPGWEDWELK
jgi:hypothetical protein